MKNEGLHGAEVVVAGGQDYHGAFFLCGLSPGDMEGETCGVVTVGTFGDGSGASNMEPWVKGPLRRHSQFT